MGIVTHFLITEFNIDDMVETKAMGVVIGKHIDISRSILVIYYDDGSQSEHYYNSKSWISAGIDSTDALFLLDDLYNLYRLPLLKKVCAGTSYAKISLSELGYLISCQYDRQNTAISKIKNYFAFNDETFPLRINSSTEIFETSIILLKELTDTFYNYRKREGKERNLYLQRG